jgi:hypothetical protein
MLYHFEFPPNTKWEFLLFYIHTSILHFGLLDFGQANICTVVSSFFKICISLLTCDLWHLSNYLFSMSMSFKVFNSFSNCVVWFLIVQFTDFFFYLFWIKYILWKDTFSEPGACLFMLLRMSFTEKNFLNFNEVHLSIISSWSKILVLYLKNHHHIQGHLAFLSSYLLRVLYFCILHLVLWVILKKI